MEKHCPNCGYVEKSINIPNANNITYLDLFGGDDDPQTSDNITFLEIPISTNTNTNVQTDDPNQHNGLITKIWGPSGWEFEHSISFGYPVNPTQEKKEEYLQHFKSLANVLPCKYCRESYKIFIESEPTVLNMKVMESRATLTKWLYDIHQRVNQKLGVDYGVSYEDIVDRYESFRAKCKKDPDGQGTQKGCVAPLDYKAFSFRKLNSHDPPLIPMDLTEKFVILNENSIDPNWLVFYIFAKERNLTMDQLKHSHKEVWCDRNRYCQQIIKDMRENSIPSIVDGKLTQGELRLILMMSSNLTKDELEKYLSSVS
jgi:hypothetical protein